MRTILLFIILANCAYTSTQVFSIQSSRCDSIVQCTIPVFGNYTAGILLEQQNELGSISTLTIYDGSGTPPHYCSPNGNWYLTNIGGLTYFIQGSCTGLDPTTGMEFTLQYIIIANIIVPDVAPPFWAILSGVITLTM